MAGKCLRCHSENAGEEAAFASGICKINGYFPFIATLRLKMNRVGVMVILWEPTPGLGIPDGFSLHSLFSILISIVTTSNFLVLGPVLFHQMSYKMITAEFSLQ